MLSSSDATARVKILERTVIGLRMKEFDEGDASEASSTVTPNGVKYNVFEQRIEEQSRQIQRFKQQVCLLFLFMLVVCDYYCPVFIATCLMSSN